MNFVPQEQNSFDEISNSSSFSIKDKINISIKATIKLFDMHIDDIFHSEISSEIFIYDNISDDVTIASIVNTNIKENDDVPFEKLQYLSPEQTGRVNQVTDYRSDLYSFGIVLFKLFTQKYPFDHKDPIKLIHSHIAQKPPCAKSLNTVLPQSLSMVIDKLLKKDPDERYQSANGLCYDLQQVLSQLSHEDKTQITLASKDISHRPIIPQKVYGRATDVSVINELYHNVSKTKHKELLTLCGYSGIGKTSLIQQIYRSVRMDKSYLLKGKFIQYRNDIPYFALKEALSEFVNYIMLEDDDKIEAFREKIETHLGVNVNLICEMIPQLGYIIHTKEELPDLNPLESQNRFNLTFLNFIKLICDFEGSIVLCLDDMQWADLATIKMIQNIMNDKNINNILIVISYRNNEVKKTHPLYLMLEELNYKKIRHTSINLRPLLNVDINEMLSDTFNTSKEKTKELSKLIKQKTNGNPFFAKEFIYNLYDEKMLYFDAKKYEWDWDLTRIKEENITDNVVDLLLKKISYLSDQSIQILKFASCLKSITINKIASILQVSETSVNKSIKEAIELGIVLPKVDKNDFTKLYKFSHDKVQEALYSLLGEKEKQLIHLKIGHFITKNIDKKQLNKKLFSITDHLNKAYNQIKSKTQKNELALYNYKAAQRAKESNAYDNAIKYLNNISLVLDNKKDEWLSSYKFSLSVYTLLCEVYYLNLDFKKAKECYTLVSKNAKTIEDKIEIVQIQIYSLIAQNKMQEALDLGLDIIKQFGIMLPSEDDLFVYYPELLSLYKGKSIGDFIHLPKLEDKNALHIVDILNSIMSPAYLASPVTYPKICYAAVKLCLEKGICAASANVFSVHALLLCGFFDKFKQGHEFSQLSQDIVGKFGTNKYSCKVEMISNACVVHWNKPLKQTLEPMKKSILVGIDNGDIEYAGYSSMYYCLYSLFAGISIDELLNEYRVYLNLMKELKQEYQIHYISVWYQFLLNLKENKKNPCELEGEIFSEKKLLKTLEDNNNVSTLYCLYLAKAILALLFDETKLAYEYINKAKVYLLGVASLYHYNEFHFYESLITYNYYKKYKQIEEEELLELLEKNYAYYETLILTSLDNNKYKLLLINGLIQSIKRQNDPWIFFDLAAKESCLKEIPYINGICNKFAASYWNDAHMEDFANLYIQKSYKSFEKWNATILTSKLKESYPSLFDHEDKPNTFDFKNIDFESVMKASQAISEEISLENLLNKIMKIIVENSGSQLGYLLLQNDKKLQVEAAYDFLTKSSTKEIKTVITMPNSIINFVKRSQKNVIYNSISQDKLFGNDVYIKEFQPKSIFCLPIIYKKDFLGILYLENRDINNLYTEDKIEFLKLLSHQAAISIDHAKLFKQTIDHSNTLEESVDKKTKELQHAVEELRIHATIDAMTGLNNRRYFFELSTNLFYRAKKDKESLHAFVLDIDDFKSINDTFGHAIGDQAIKLFSKAINKHNGEKCILGRLGGDEFVMLTLGKDNNTIDDFVSHIKQNVYDIELKYANNNINITTSIGVSHLTNKINSLDELILEADNEMYKDKSKKKTAKPIRNRS